MRLKNYIEKNGELITNEIRNDYLPFLTTDGQDVLNESFILEYGMKEMFSDNVEINNRKIKNILLKNYDKYDKINEALKSQLSVEYNKLIEDDGKDLRDLNLTDLRTPELTHKRTPDLTDERKPDLTDLRTPDLTDERKPELTDTRTPLTTTTTTAGIKETIERVEPKKTKTSTTSTKPFDSNDFIETDKTVEVEGSVVETEPISADYKTTETRTPSGTETVSESGTDTTKYTGKDTTTHKGTETTTHKGSETTTHKGTETTTETGTDTTKHTGTDTLTKSNIQKIKDENILEYLNKYMEFYSYNLYIPIIEDIISILCYATWDSECSFFEIIE